MSLWKKQRQLLLSCVGTALVTGTVVCFLVIPGDQKKSKPAFKPVNAQIQTPKETVQSNELWMQQISEESKVQNKKLEVIEQIVQKQVLKGNDPDLSKVDRLEKEIEFLKNHIQNNMPNSSSSPVNTNPAPSYSPLVKHAIALKSGRYKVGNRIPAGSYVKGVLLSAVDASVGVNVASDPQPVVMRLLGDGRLPNNACSHMKRCHITGSAVGDLSSERVFIRLEKMSCVDTRTQMISETDVHGYVTSEDGKNGLAGVVVDRSGRMISGAVLSGLLGGASSFLQNWATAKQNEITTSRLGDRGVQNNVLSSDFVKGGAQGVSNAFDKLADYYIKRAEQLQPVVQVNPGRVVNIVFSKGSNIGLSSQNLSQEGQK